jgi:hypothetical protein
MIIRLLCVVFVFLLPACGAKSDFAKANKLRTAGKYVESTVLFDRIYKKFPESELGPAACLEIAEIYRTNLKLFTLAQRYYKELLNKYPAEAKYVEKAKLGLLNSPDYFPLYDGSFWIEGDSESGGKAMRAERNCSQVADGLFKIEYKYYAGSELVTKFSRYYRKSGYDVIEAEDRNFTKPAVILSYPFTHGRQWTTIKGGKKTILTVIAERMPEKVQSNSFTDCLKISEESPDMSGSKVYNYYAPEAGWILKTTAAKESTEHRISELLSYKIVQK